MGICEGLRLFFQPFSDTAATNHLRHVLQLHFEIQYLLVEHQVVEQHAECLLVLVDEPVKLS